MSIGATASSSRSAVAVQAHLQVVDDSPLLAQLPLGALTTAVPCARAYTRVVLDEWGLPDLADSAELIVSELVTNSVQASADEEGRPRYSDDGLPVVHLRLAFGQARVLIEVWDSIPAPPVARQTRLDEEGGRGLTLIHALAERWGWTRVPGWPGKVVWAELQPEWP